MTIKPILLNESNYGFQEFEDQENWSVYLFDGDCAMFQFGKKDGVYQGTIRNGTTWSIINVSELPTEEMREDFEYYKTEDRSL